MFDRLRHGLARLKPRPARGAAAAAPALRPAANDAAAVREFACDLPPGWPARRVRVRVDIPRFSGAKPYRFTDHLAGSDGRATRTVLATTVGGFAISDDLGESWRDVHVRAHRKERFIHVHAMGGGEYLAQIEPDEQDETKSAPIDMIVVDEEGRVLASHPSFGTRWHGCRAVDRSGDTVMYAEYPSGKNTRPPRVMRSRDRGRTWTSVFDTAPGQVRHFHFLQCSPQRTGKPREWFLTSGDTPQESRIWISRDDGDTWIDLTDVPLRFKLDGVRYTRSIFRLTDMVWDGEDIVWGTDDELRFLKADAGARFFRGRAEAPLMPRVIGRTRWHVRNLVACGDFVFAMTQGANAPDATGDDRRPSVLLLARQDPQGAPGVAHLFDIDVHSDLPRAGRGFTYSKASRAACDGTFFTYRAPYHLFPGGHQILRWNVRFE